MGFLAAGDLTTRYAYEEKPAAKGRVGAMSMNMTGLAAHTSADDFSCDIEFMARHFQPVFRTFLALSHRYPAFFIIVRIACFPSAGPVFFKVCCRSLTFHVVRLKPWSNGGEWSNLKTAAWT